MASLTLLRQASSLANPANQVEILETRNAESLRDFDQTLGMHGLPALQADGIDVLQVNVGRLCNQTCEHCHVDAGPDRREAMTLDTAKACLRVLAESGISTLDITGGAPEMNPHFRYLVSEARQLGRRVIDRCNLTILLAPGFEDLPEFLARHQVEVVASLPCYLQENCDRQRGNGVFHRSIEALRRLNGLGYGLEGGPTLTLVYNPLGPSLPPVQQELEEAYRRELRGRHGVEFTRLFTITNMPISRFLDDLLRSGRYEHYMRTLIESFNPLTVEGVMCRSMLSVDWRGRLFDCDFNQMLELGVARELPPNIRDVDRVVLARIARRRITTGRHCFGCTAGDGSSCQGSLSE
jgi:radical SAM/Cys-rich protein